MIEAVRDVIDRLVQKLAEAAPVDGPGTSAEDDPESPAQVT